MKTEHFEVFHSKKHFDLLDGIRGIAILAVIWHHSVGLDPLPLEFFGRGYLGVDLFFVLSGFLITHLLLKERRATGSISLKQFYIRRTLRIFPLYYTYIIVVMTWAWLTNQEQLDEMTTVLPYYLLYVSNFISPDAEQFFRQAWSLAVEEQFYLLWPPVLMLFGVRVAITAIAAIVLASTIASFGVLGEAALNVSEHLVPYRTILLGCLLAIGLASPTCFTVLHRYLAWRYCATVLLFSIALIIAFFSGKILGIRQLAIHVLMAMFLAACVLNENNPLRVILKPLIMRTLGVVSYGIYILHGQFWGLTHKIVSSIPVEQIAQSKTAFFIVFTAISLSVALCSYHFFEVFFLKLKQRFRETNAKPAASPIGVA
jgi:peptidoglycan/LPS O-acetylase OafA/YrhL